MDAVALLAAAEQADGYREFGALGEFGNFAEAARGGAGDASVLLGSVCGGGGLAVKGLE